MSEGSRPQSDEPTNRNAIEGWVLKAS